MDITPPGGLPPAPPSAPPATREQPLPLQPGQTLTAIATAASQQGRVSVSINGTSFSAVTGLPILAGEQVAVTVVRTGGSLLLTVIPPAPPAGPAETTLRAMLPRQTPVNQLLVNLIQLGITQTGTAPPLPAPVLEATRQLMQRLPRTDQLRDASSVLEAITRSGVLYEAGLAAARGGPGAADLKGALLLLAESLRRQVRDDARSGGAPAAWQPPPLKGAPMTALPTPAPSVAVDQDLQTLLAELLRNTEGALARLRVTQLGNLPARDEGSGRFTLELPFVHDAQVTTFQLAIEPDRAERQDGAGPGWQMMLAFSLAPLGPVYVRLSLRASRLGIAWWAEYPATVRLLETHMPQFRSRLAVAGIDVFQVQCHHGIPAGMSGSMTSSQRLVDERA